MKNKKDVYVVVDTPKKAKKLKNLLDIFNEQIYEETNKRLTKGGVSEEYPNVHFLFNGEWIGDSRKEGISGKTKVSIKELKNILAKEHLKVGDYVVLSDDGEDDLCKFERMSDIFEGQFRSEWYTDMDCKNIQKTGGIHEHFKRYATPEEIALLDPKPKEFVVGKWYHLSWDGGWCLAPFKGKDVASYGFHSDNGWMDDVYWFSDYNMNRLKQTEATSQEIESALIEEAKKRGYKECIKIHSFIGGDSTLSPTGTTHFFNEKNELMLNGCIVFKAGIWATIIEQDKFAELKEAHKNGSVIQMQDILGNWHDVSVDTLWLTDKEYRIKPSFEELPKPNVLVWVKRKNGVYLAKRNGNPRSKNQDPSKNCDWNGIRFDEIKKPSDHNSGVHFPYYFSDITVEEWEYIEQPKWNNDTEYRIKPEENPKVGDVVKADYGDDFSIKILRPSDLSSPLFKYTKLTQQEAIDLLFNK